MRIRIENEPGVAVNSLAPALVRMTGRRLLKNPAVMDALPGEIKCHFGGLLVDATFVSSPTIQRLNRKYRDQDSPTDVLSFPHWSADDAERFPAIPPESKEGLFFLGEIMVCPSIAAERSPEGRGGLCAILFTTGHGLLHLLGWEHPTREKLDRMNDTVQRCVDDVLPFSCSFTVERGKLANR